MLRKNIQATAGRIYPHTLVMEGKFAAESKTLFLTQAVNMLFHTV